MYLALYRKYRPNTFDDVISQEHITTTLKNQIAAGQIAHAYLFTGTRGTGKTSCAKIMAKAVNCLSPVNGNPCGKCETCRAIDGGSTDIIEIDAASNNGVDSIRQIRDEVIYTPIDCKYKVYIIDEVHMLTGAAFNALLKTLEEPPSHVVFILATTEYYKVPATILSRCQQFMFSKIDPQQSAQRLLEVAAKEQITLTPDAAALIARLSDGAMRDALSLLDQCISADSNVDSELVRKCSGSADSGYLFTVSEAAINQKPADALAVLDKLINQGKDLSRFIEELTLHYRNLMLIKTVGKGLVKASDGDLKKYGEQCEKYSLDEIMRHIDLISDSLDNINRMKQTGQGRLLSEQLLIRITSPKLTNDASALAARLGALEEKVLRLTKNGIGASPETAKPVISAFDNLDNNVGNIRQAPENTGCEIAENTEEITPARREDAGTQTADDSVKEGGDFSIGKENTLDGQGLNEAVGIDDIPLPPPPDESFDSADYNYFELRESTRQLLPPIDEATAATIKRTSEKTPAKAEIIKGDYSAEKKESESRAAAESSMPPKASEEPAADVIHETDFELPDNAPPLPQWDEIISGLAGSAGRLLKKSKAYLYGGKIYIEASASAKTVLTNGTKAAALRERTASVMGGGFEMYLLRERRAADAEKEDKIAPFLDKARAMGIEVTVRDK